MKLSAKYWISNPDVLRAVPWLGARELNTDEIWYGEWWSLYIG